MSRREYDRVTCGLEVLETIMMNAGDGYKVPRRMRERYEAVTEVTDEFC